MKEHQLITSSLLIFLAMVQRMVIKNDGTIALGFFVTKVLTIQTSQRKLLLQFRAWDNSFWFRKLLLQFRAWDNSFWFED